MVMVTSIEKKHTGRNDATKNGQQDARTKRKFEYTVSTN